MDPDQNNDQSNEQQDWRALLPDELKASPTLADVKSVESLAKQFVDQAKHLGSSLRVPSENASEEDVAAFHAKLMDKAPNLMFKPNPDDEQQMALLYDQLGRPKEPTEYELTVDLKGYTPPEDQVQFIRDAAHKAGLTKKQYEQLAGALLMRDSDATSHAKEKLNESRTELMREWGMAFDDRIKQATDMLKKTGAPESLVKAAEDGSLGSETLKWAYGLVTSLGSETLETHGQNGDSGRITPAEAKAQIAEIMSNRNHDFWNSRSPNHSKAQKDMIELHRAAGMAG